MLWDELVELNELVELKPTPQCTCNGCTCGASQAIADLALFTELLQFLMGWGEEFDNIRQQILVMDPVPSINKAYSMISSVEKQKQVHMMESENVAMHTRTDYRRDFREVTRMNHTRISGISTVIIVKNKPYKTDLLQASWDPEMV
ncbi:UNVERIFIED_CONTAM: hypothetical protein Slati_0170500 [Sesamum latifolium]|uniref:Uncharacterized protein n=1 Tax=Sesamum latifolium TaxID=2727402 RepID=A0AAW2YAR2_9LAMI